MSPDNNPLYSVRTFNQLVKYLKDELGWPIETDDFDDLTFDYAPEELGLETDTAVKIKEIKQLRPLTSKQPWGIFFVSFAPKQLPVVALRRILSSLVIKKRQSANKSQQAAWRLNDLLFISSYGETDHRDITFAHFAEEVGYGDLPTLRLLGWDDEDTKLKLDYVEAQLKEKLRWPDDEGDVNGWRDRWSAAFRLRPREVIKTSQQLAIRLADLARGIRKRANAVLEVESTNGPLRKMHAAFKEALIHDLTTDDFADMYAQTISYGLLTARVSRPTGLVADNLSDMIPVTNPFLKDLLDTFLTVGGRKGKIDFDELGINEVVQLLRDADMEAVLRDFGDRNPQEDPVIHFYELFLKEYDPRKRMQRGVFYTPRPVVSYIVRSLDELLRTKFGLADGLADTATWADMEHKLEALQVPNGVSREEPFVRILDPAVGTGTFLVEAIDIIHRTMEGKWRKQGHGPVERQRLWNEYVPKHLLPRMYGFELMMAPYAIAHMKIGLKLFETGYRFGSDERAHVYLTNSLEPALEERKQRQFEDWAPALAHEAAAVNSVKHDKRFTVLLGNPPYSNFGQLNRIEFILALLADYKRGLNERKINLDDDYIKFLRFAHWQIHQTSCGVIGYITNHSYLDGMTHRAMRRSIFCDFQNLQFLNLHGSAVRSDTVGAGKADENVFEIKQGVAITQLALIPGAQSQEVKYGDLIGTRDYKYDMLSGANTRRLCETKLLPEPEYYYFVPIESDVDDLYQSALSLPTLMPIHNSGIQTKQDALSIHFRKAELEETLNDLRSLPLGKIRAKYDVGPDGRDWQLGWAQADVRDSKDGEIIRIAYRPFDERFTFYTGKSKGFIAYPRHETSRHFLEGPNLGLCTLRQTVDDGFRHALVTNNCNEANILISHHVSQQTFPLYLYPPNNLWTKDKVSSRRANLDENLLVLIGSRLGLTPLGDGKGDCKKNFGPEDLFSYVYALLYAPSYRKRYQELLKKDYPRVFLPRNAALFSSMAGRGCELISTHLLDSPKLKSPGCSYFGSTHPAVEKVTYVEDTVWLDIEHSCGFRNVKGTEWSFRIGGYQVCDKWLKDRKGRVLSKSDIEHYQKIVASIRETIRLMSEVDKLIDEHGGWPGAFAPS